MCEHYDILEEIYSGKANINPPYIYQSASAEFAGAAMSYNRLNASEPNDLIVYDPDGEHEEDEPWPWDNVYGNTMERDYVTTNSASAVSTAATIDTLASSGVETNKRNRSPTPASEDTVSRFKKSLLTIPVNKPGKPGKPIKFESNATNAMADWQMQRTEVIVEKNKILTEKYNLEGKWKENEHKLAEQKFHFEMDSRNKELELKKMEIEKEEKLKKLEMEKDERLAALKMEYEYKLQLQLGKENRN